MELCDDVIYIALRKVMKRLALFTLLILGCIADIYRVTKSYYYVILNIQLVFYYSLLDEADVGTVKKAKVDQKSVLLFE